MAETRPCPICRETAQVQPYSGALYFVKCPRCGPYEAAGIFVRGQSEDREFTDQKRWSLSRVLRSYYDEHGEHLDVAIHNKSYPDLIAGQPPPSSVDARIAELLLTVARKTAHLGDQTDAEPLIAWAGRLGVPTATHAERIVDAAGSLGFLEVLNRSAHGPISMKLTLPGWREVERLRSAGHESIRAFVAMWFHDRMNEVFAQAIRPAIKECGLEPLRIDLVGHNDRIDDRIMAEIRRSRVLVADLTGHRGGVYFEAGFAMGLGIPVIWTCNESWQVVRPRWLAPESEAAPEVVSMSWFEDVHFDVSHFNILKWRTLDELRERLEWRIRATGLSRP